jgi:hypothetical protein
VTNLNRKTIIIGSIAAGLLIAGTIILAVCLGDSRVPDPQTASARQIVNLFSSEKIDEMSREKKAQYFKTFIEHNQGSAEQQVVSQMLAGLSDAELDQIKKNGVEAVGWFVLERSRQFNSARTGEEKEKIAQQMVAEIESYNSFARSLIHLAPNVQKTAPKDPSDSLNIIMKYIPPADFAKMEPLMTRCLEIYMKKANHRKIKN